MADVQLPEGFILDNSSDVKLPEGFVLDSKKDDSLLSKGKRVLSEISKAGEGALEALSSTVSGIPATLAGVAAGLTTQALTAVPTKEQMHQFMTGGEMPRVVGDTEAAKAVEEGVARTLTYQPKTETGKRYAEQVGKVLGAPAEIGREIVRLPLESWKASPDVAYPAEKIAEFAAYPGVIKGTSLAKNLVRDALVEKGLKLERESKPSEYTLEQREGARLADEAEAKLFQSEADRLGIKFDGVNPEGTVGAGMPQFSADVDGVKTTFSLNVGESVEQALSRKFSEKKTAEASTVSAEEIKLPEGFVLDKESPYPGYREVGKDEVLQPGADVKMDMKTGKNYVKKEVKPETSKIDVEPESWAYEGKLFRQTKSGEETVIPKQEEFQQPISSEKVGAEVRAKLATASNETLKKAAEAGSTEAREELSKRSEIKDFDTQGFGYSGDTTLYSGIDPTQIGKAVNAITRSAKEGWDSLVETSPAAANLERGARLTKQGFREEFLDPERVMSSTPKTKQVFDVMSDADMNSNAFILEHFSKYEEAIKGLKKGSKESERLGRALEGELERGELTKQEQKAYDFLKKDFEMFITGYAKRVAGSKESYEKVLKEVGRQQERVAKVSELPPDRLKEYEALRNEISDIRGKKKTSELSREDRDTISSIRQEMRDILSDYARRDWTEGEIEAYTVLSRKKNDYLPHLFDPKELKEMFAQEIADIKKALETATNKSAITNYKNRLTKLEAAVERMNGGKLVRFNQLPSEVFFKFFEPRKGAEGYSRDALKAYETYLFSIARKMFDEPALKKISRELFNDIDPSLKPYTQRLIDYYMGYGKQKPLDWLAGAITSFEWIRTLGLNPRSALVNLSQRINTMAYIGEKYTLAAEKMMLFDKAKADALFAKSGIAREVPNVMTEGKIPKGMERIRDIAGFMFDKVELGNRKNAYLAGYLKAIGEGKSEAAAIKSGTDAVHKTQFRYGRLGTAEVYRNPYGRVALQFTSYPMKQAQFLYDLWKKDPVALMKYIAYAEGVNYTVQKFLDTDMSNAMGLGVTWGEGLKVIESLAKGDERGALRHAKQMIQPGGGLLPSGFGPTVTGAYKVAEAAKKGKGFEQLKKELTPVIVNRVTQAYDALKDERNGLYAIKDANKHTAYRLTGRQLLQRTIGPKTETESKISREQEAKKNLELERKEVLTDITNALVDKDIEKAKKLVKKYGIVPSSDMIKNELLARELSRDERRKVGKPETYQLLREGRIY